MKRLTDKEWITTKHFQKLNAEEVLRRLWELENGFDSGKYLELPCIKKAILSFVMTDYPCYLLIYQDKYGKVKVKCYGEDKLEYAEDRLKEIKGEE